MNYRKAGIVGFTAASYAPCDSEFPRYFPSAGQVPDVKKLSLALASRLYIVGGSNESAVPTLHDLLR